MSNVSLISEAVRAMCALCLSDKDAKLLSICLFEAVTNAIRHAYNNSPDHEVEVIVSIDEDKIRFEVIDSGEFMKQTQKPDLDFDPEDIENLPESGMGLFIVDKIMDQVTYESSEGKNILTMIKKL